MRTIKYLVLILITFLLPELLTCTDAPTAGNSSQTGNPVMTGKLCEMDGKPAEGVEVKIYNVNHLPSDVNADTAYYTDSKGEYVIPLPDSGAYNIIGQASNKSVFIDSVKVEDTVDVEVPTDTIKPSGGIIGVSHLVGQNDTNQIRVTLFIPGTNYLTKPNIGGSFSIPKVPEGTYALFFDPTDPAYFVKIIEVTVTAGETTGLDTIILYSESINGIPIVNLGNDTTVSINDTIRINGTASDTYGYITSMEWSISGSNFIPASSPDTVIVAPSVENLNYSFILKVVDNDQNVAYDTLIAQVKTDPPVAVITCPDTALLNSNITLGSSSSTSGDFGQIIKYEWSIDSLNNFKEASGNDTTATVDSTETDSFTVLLRVTDDDGNTDCDTAYIVITRKWEVVGIKGFSDGAAYEISISTDENNIPYVAYQDMGNNGRATVMKFNGSNWEAVGIKGFSDDSAYYLSFGIDNSNVPYVAYQDFANESKATVMKFNGSSWEAVGNKGFSDGLISETSLSIDDNNVPYVAYIDFLNGDKVTVMKFNGTIWEAVGNKGFSDGISNYLSLSIDGNNVPHVSFKDEENGGRTTVMKFNNIAWEAVGIKGFSDSAAYFLSLSIDGNNIPYVSYRDDAHGSKATVMKSNGTVWEPVGIKGFSDDVVGYTSLMISRDNVPYIAYTEGRIAKVMKFDNTNWVPIGSQCYNYADKVVSIFVDKNSILYVSFRDEAEERKCTVMRYR